MQECHFRKAMAAASGAAPPLAEVQDVGVVERHVVRQTPNRPAGLANSHRRFGIFTGNHVVPIAAGGDQRVNPKKRNAAEARCFATNSIPFMIAKRVVD